jgi:hypothetical protein
MISRKATSSIVPIHRVQFFISSPWLIKSGKFKNDMLRIPYIPNIRSPAMIMDALGKGRLLCLEGESRPCAKALLAGNKMAVPCQAGKRQCGLMLRFHASVIYTIKDLLAEVTRTAKGKSTSRKHFFPGRGTTHQQGHSLLHQVTLYLASWLNAP